jgi:DNA-binding NarL/FixJ family response regulator
LLAAENREPAGAGRPVNSRRKVAGLKKRLLLVDDHPMMREGLTQLIGHEPDLEICGEAGDANEALEKINLLHPDLVLTDITLPGKNGVELIKDIQALHTGTLVLVLSMHDESLYVERVLRAGARGYVMKQEGGKKIMEAIRVVLNGQIHVSEKMSSKILEVFSGRRSGVASSPIEKLTDREFEVFQLIGQGLGTKQMAEQLHLSTKTIEVHRANIKAKLQAGNMSELIRQAVRWVESQHTG